MKKLFLIPAVALGLALAPMAMAQTARPVQNECTQGSQKSCTAPAGSAKSQNKTQNKVQNQTAQKQTGQKQSAQKQSAPKVGGSAKSGKPFQQGKNSRFQTPPKGQEYRVMDNHLVLADKSSQKIVKVLGLLDALTK